MTLLYPSFIASKIVISETCELHYPGADSSFTVELAALKELLQELAKFFGLPLPIPKN